MRAGRLLWYEVLMRMFVGLLDALLVRPFNIGSDLIVSRSH